MTKEEAQKRIAEVCDEIKELLLAKNEAYGNSVFEPIQCFAKCDALEQVRVRIDDKLKRFQSGSEFAGDDTVVDLIGYLVILKVGADAKNLAVGKAEDAAAERPDCVPAGAKWQMVTDGLGSKVPAWALTAAMALLSVRRVG